MKKAPFTHAFALYALGVLVVLGAFSVAQSAYAAGPSIVLGQGLVDATSSYNTNGNYGEWSALAGNGYSGRAEQIVVAIGPGTSNRWANTSAYIYAASTTQNQHYVDATCAYAASSTADMVQVGTSDEYLLTMRIQSETNGGCTLRPDYYTEVRILYPRGGFIGSATDFYWGSAFNNKNWQWSNQGMTSALGCGGTSGNICIDPGFYPYFNVLGPGWSLVPTTTTSGFSLSGAQAYCNSVFASSTGIGYDIMNGFCVATGFLFIPSSDAVQSFTSIPQLLAGTFPFSWAFQAQSALESATASTSDNFISLAVDVGTSTSSFHITNAPLISTSTLASYPGWDGIRNTFKGILTASFYLAALYAIYRTIIRIWYTA